jgi:gas vesicle protein
LAKQLQAQLSDLEALRANNKLLTTKANDLMEHLKRVSGEHEDSLRANEQAQSTIRHLQDEIHQQTATIRTLRRERGSILGLSESDLGESDLGESDGKSAA